MGLFSKGPNVGDTAPDFELDSQRGESIRLSALVEEKPVVLYFYPKDNTPICTRESCAFRDKYQDFQDAGAEVIGISRDDLDSHERFADKHRLPFHLLSDNDGAVHRDYGALLVAGIPKRITFVVDRQRVIRKAFVSQFSAQRHVNEALEMVRALR